MKTVSTNLPGVIIVEPRRFADDRGFFSECWSARTYAAGGIDLQFVQDNHSFSTQTGTVRGLHYQAPPHAQAKLVRCGRGRIFDVAVDIRKGSPTYGQWTGAELSFDNGLQFLVPAGFLHGFMTLEDDCEVLYKCDDYYAAECDGAVHWQSCGIEWPDTPAVHLSAKDEGAVALNDFVSPFTFEE